MELLGLHTCVRPTNVTEVRSNHKPALLDTFTDPTAVFDPSQVAMPRTLSNIKYVMELLGLKLTAAEVSSCTSLSWVASVPIVAAPDCVQLVAVVPTV